jgi:DNA-binding NarL/FixJ family response regulator
MLKAQQMASDAEGSALERGRVLVVDDSSAFRRAARQLLERRGYTVAGEAATAAAAIDAVESLNLDAVLLDIGLPDTSGRVVASYLRVYHPRLAVLLVSADNDVESEKLLEQTGASGYLPKSSLSAADLAIFWPVRGETPR